MKAIVSLLFAIALPAISFCQEIDGAGERDISAVIFFYLLGIAIGLIILYYVIKGAVSAANKPLLEELKKLNKS